MKILLYGSGAREHALAWKLNQSPILSTLYLCGANDGFKHLGETIEANDFKGLAKIAKEKEIDLLIVGAEQPLADGIVDVFADYGIRSIGMPKSWARLESSKSFAKEFMMKHDIPTSKYKPIENKEDIEVALNSFKAPYVVKADGLAAGKGVAITNDLIRAKTNIAEILNGKFDSKKALLEEFQNGEEMSLISFYDGKTLLSMRTARDYKPLLDGDKGANTGGMGAYCPVDLSQNQTAQLIDYEKKLEKALNDEKADFCGIIYSGLIFNDKNELKVLEYNVRFGDPEAQVLLVHLKTDLLEIFNAMTKQELHKIRLEWQEGYSACVVVAANGYPENPKKGAEVIIPDNDCKIFFAGVKKTNNNLYSNGGRVLSVCGNNINKVYKTVQKIEFKDKIYRTDIKLY